jgi:UTP--glucose-1-phosphate uridylyltransferase
VALVDAVVPCAGRGTRLAPLTLAVPKVLLPVGRKPVVQRVVEELAACGVRRVALVVGSDEGAVLRHFEAGGAPAGVTLQAVAQDVPLGLGDAVARARDVVGGPFAVAVGDAVLGHDGRARVVARLGAALEAGASAAIAVREVPAERVSRYGIVDVDRQDAVRGIVEKPLPAAAPSRLAVAARWALTPVIFEALERTPPGPSGEVELTDALAALVAEGERVVAVRLGPDEPRWDVGAHGTYAEAFRHFAALDAADA